MRHLKLLFLVGFGYLVPATAQAAQPHGVLSGASLSYNNAGTNLLGTDSGNVYVDSVAANLPSNFAPLANYCLTVTAAPLGLTVIAQLSYYYVYYVDVPGGGANNNFYISNVAPSSDGHPGAAIWGNGGAGCATPGPPGTTNAVFLGSFMTDNSMPQPQVVPFWRTGDDVLLDAAAVDLTSSVPLAKGATATTPVCDSPGFLNRFPRSASAYLLDIAPLSSSCTAANQLYVCPVVSAHFNCPMGAPSTNKYESDVFTIPATPALSAEYKQYRLQAQLQGATAPQFCLNGYAGTCGAPITTITYTYTGYVEKIPLPMDPY